MKEMTKPKPRTIEGGNYVETDTVKTHDIWKFTSTPPAPVVEGMLAETIKEMYSTFAVTAFAQSNKLTMMESFTAAVNVSIACLGEATQLLSTCQLATLTPKHRALARVVPVWLHRFEYFAEAIKGHEENAIEVKEAAKEAMQVLSIFHILMDEKTNQKFRDTVSKDILESLNVS